MMYGNGFGCIRVNSCPFAVQRFGLKVQKREAQPRMDANERE